MDRNQDTMDKDSFRQAGQDLLRKVREAEQEESRRALSSWQEVESRLGLPRKTSGFRISYLVSSVAATVAILLAVGCYFWMSGRHGSSLPLAMLEKDSVIVVPKGQRTSVMLSDGTRVNVNAGTRLIYPAQFATDRREIVVEGEVFLDVTPDPSRPFIVKANGFDVKVLGTRFNVCAYKDDAMASVVLVEGKVEVRTSGNEKAILAPNQLIEINEQGANIKDVNVFEYICWKDDLMVLDNHKVGEIFDKLARYYGRTILFDKEIGEIPISGKLDLHGKLEDVIHIVCQSFYLKQETDQNNRIIISK